MSKKKQSPAPKSPRPNPRTSPAPERKTGPAIHFDGLESWLKDRRMLLAGLVVGISLLLRLVYFYQAKDTLIAQYHQWDNSDMAFFDSWARHLAAGDWRNAEAPHPLHTWHKDIISSYFKKYPQDSLEYARIAASDPGLTPEKAVIKDWYGGKTFHQEPLYVYLVALTYKVFGPQPVYVFLWQMLLGILINLLIFLLAARYTNYTTAVVAGLLAAFCGPMLCYDMVLLRTTLTAFIFLAALWSLERALDRPTALRCAGAGAVMALSVLTQSYGILFFIMGFGLLWWRWMTLSKVLPAAGLMLLGFLIVMAPVVYRNMSVGVNPGSIASIGGPAFIAANVKDTDPNVSFMVVEDLFVDIMHETHGSMWASIQASVATYDSFWGFLGFQFDKLRTVFFWYELPNNMNYYLYQEMAPVLKWLPVTQFVIAPLCLLGMVFWLMERRKQCLPWLALWLVAMVPLLFGIPLSRYRIGFMAASIIPAAYAIVYVFKALVSAAFSKKMAVLAGVCVAFFLTTQAVDRTGPRITYDELSQFYQIFFVNDMKRLREEKNYAQCVEVYDRFMRFEPEFLKKVGPARKLRNAEEKSLAAMFKNMHGNRGVLLQTLGRNEEANQDFKRSEALDLAIQKF